MIVGCLVDYAEEELLKSYKAQLEIFGKEEKAIEGFVKEVLSAYKIKQRVKKLKKA